MIDISKDSAAQLNIIIAKAKLQEVFLNKMSVMPIDIRSMTKSFFISGGCIGSFLRNEPSNDIDIWCTDDNVIQLIKASAKKNIDYVKDTNKKYISCEVEGKLITGNAITFANDLQIITMASGTPKEIVAHFDYLHCTPWYMVHKNALHITSAQYDACMNKKLVVNNAKMAKRTKEAFRYQKLKEQGFTE